MANIKLIGKKGSKACREIRAGADIRGYLGKTKVTPDVIINYGLPKDQLDTFFRRYPSAKHVPIVNRFVGYSKYNAAIRANSADIKTPESKLSLTKGDKLSEWIEKRTNSIGGKGICAARGKRPIAGKYYQRFIKDRRYELRVHAFKWLPQDDWCIQKRLGSVDEIAWNYKNGGRFVSVIKARSYDMFVRAAKVSDEVLDMLGMKFGAVDFLVDTDRNLYFIEINSAPGFTELSKPIYVNAFNELRELSATKALKYTN